jgi:uncharacterized membrane protein
MLRKLLGFLAAGLIVLSTGCAVIVSTPVQTTVTAENDMTNLTMAVGGQTKDIVGIDLIDVTIGDVYYSYVPYGHTTSSKVTHRSGDVSVYIDTAVVYFQNGVTTTIPNAGPLTVNIKSEEPNPIVFGTQTATAILQVLGKKKAPQVK